MRQTLEMHFPYHAEITYKPHTEQLGMILDKNSHMKARAPQSITAGEADTLAAIRRILIVDDEPAILFAYRKLLERENIVVDTSENLAEALEMIGTRPYFAVIADMRLAGTDNADGMQILRSIQEKQTDARVILVTGYGNKEIEQTAIDLGVAYYFEKPVMPSAILAALKTMAFAMAGWSY